MRQSFCANFGSHYGKTSKNSLLKFQARIIEAVQAGNYMETAAQYANIGLSTFYRWMAEGEGEKAPKRQREFREAVLQARAQAEVRNVTLIQRAANDGSWQAASWFLERSFQKQVGSHRES
jgi:transposase